MLIFGFLDHGARAGTLEGWQCRTPLTPGSNKKPPDPRRSTGATADLVVQ